MSQPIYVKLAKQEVAVVEDFFTVNDFYWTKNCKVCGFGGPGVPNSKTTVEDRYYYGALYCSETCCLFDDGITYEEYRYRRASIE